MRIGRFVVLAGFGLSLIASCTTRQPGPRTADQAETPAVVATGPIDATPSPTRSTHDGHDKPPIHDTSNPVAPGFWPRSVAFWDASDGLLAGWLYECRCNKHQGAVAVTHDGGKTWHVTYRGSTEVPSVAVLTDGSAVATRVDNNSTSLIRSTDGGRSWSPWPRSKGVGFATFSSPDQGLAIAQDQRRLVAWNGLSWHKTTNPCGQDIVAVSMPENGGGIGWLACSLGAGAGNELKAIYETTDGGTTWQARTMVRPDRPSLSLGTGLGSNGYMAAISFLPDGQGWLTESRGSFYSTSDGGSNWIQHIGFQQPEVAFGASVWRVNDELGYALMYRPGGMVLHVSWTGGSSWSKVAAFGSPR